MKAHGVQSANKTELSYVAFNAPGIMWSILWLSLLFTFQNKITATIILPSIYTLLVLMTGSLYE